MVHIQDEHGAKTLEPHWGYVNRVKPCVNDKGTCAYLDLVYHMHDVSMLYTFIFWAVVGGILAIWLAVRILAPRPGSSARTDGEAGQQKQKSGIMYRSYRALTASRRRWLLPEGIPSIFRHSSRLQVLILAVLSGYLLIFSLVGVGYKTWITPVKGLTGVYNTRTGFGPWGDRIGALAYALTPFTVALATRESLLSLITGVPYQHFNFLHRWTGRIIYVQGALHTLAWTVVEGKLYQPQPKVFKSFIKEQYIVFGCVALAFISFLFFFSLRPVIRMTGYEFFRKSHYIVALLYIGACWGHWYQLSCWMIASFILFGLDRGMRLIRTALIHVGKKDPANGFGFRSAVAKISTFTDEDATVLALDFQFPHAPWKTGQHFFLTFPELSIWQSHPMTPASLPTPGHLQTHRYIIRARNGETARLARLAAQKLAENGGTPITTSVILNGPHGGGVLPSTLTTHPTNILAIAGGTGISFALPIIMQAIKSPTSGSTQLIWIIRKTSNLSWIATELTYLRSTLQEKQIDLGIKIFVTRETPTPPSSPSLPSSNESLPTEKLPYNNTEKEISTPISPTPQKHTIPSDITSLTSPLPNFSVEYLGNHHPHLDTQDGSGVIEQWLARGAVMGGTNHVFASGPSGMGKDLRVAIAARNDGARVFRGDLGGDVAFYWDDRFT
ncbi:ferric reductase like transmembrane component [Venturia nashicola]|uniref:Ferric reductase like transmembrane component n=1 Tax=Venturia nashicola TaxID=86259 RepID=A0A4Z1PHI4_9PEZI|nr:ferric reductase like transmembrane component [Venturia nashicola]